MTRRESLIAILGAVMDVNRKGLLGARAVNSRNKAKVLEAIDGKLRPLNDPSWHTRFLPAARSFIHR